MPLKFLVVTVFLTSISLGCSQYPVSGYIDMADSDKYPMIYMIDPLIFSALASSFEGKVIDSARIDQNGKFIFKKMPIVDKSKMYLLTIQKPDEKYPNRLENDQPEWSNYIPFIYRTSEHINIRSSADKLLNDAVIIGDIKENDIILQLIKTRFELYINILSQQKELNETNLIDHEKALNNYQHKLMESVKDISDVYINALALRWISSSGDYERVPELVSQACMKLKQSSPGDPWTAQICKISASLPLIPGNHFPDFPMPMIKGDTVKLYTILGEKLTLIDLWASWCAPCRHENKHTLVPLWDEFHQKGFQIIGYALDSSEKGWRNAIEKDGADRWLHASHLQGDVSPLFEQLRITTIPANYLINEDGIIVAKNLHGEEMYQRVREYFKE